MQGTVQWRRKALLDTKAAVKAEIESAVPDSDPAARLQFILRRVRQTETDETSRGRMRCYVYVMSALAHHIRFRGLKPVQIRRLGDFASAILKAQDINPVTSRIAFVHGELHQALSQIYRTTGQPVLAAWEFQAAASLGATTPGTDRGFDQFGMAIRANSLGFSQWALSLFASAETAGLSPKQMIRVRLNRIKILRLLGDPTGAEALAEETLARSVISDSERLELGWEQICRQAQSSGDLTAMIQAVRRGGSHHSALYALEAQLWARASRVGRWAKKLPRIITLSRTLDAHAVGFLYRVTKALEVCEDDAQPLVERLRALGRVIATLNRLVAPDVALLTLAAASRWLAGQQLHFLATATLREYQAVSRRISDGRMEDCLGLVRDLTDKDWFRRSLHQESAPIKDQAF